MGKSAFREPISKYIFDSKFTKSLNQYEPPELFYSLQQLVDYQQTHPNLP